MPQKFESIEHAADRLDVSPKTVRRMIAQGRVTGYRIGTKLVRVASDEIDTQLIRPIPTSDG
jgi:excisionase family DNA binding protein